MHISHFRQISHTRCNTPHHTRQLYHCKFSIVVLKRKEWLSNMNKKSLQSNITSVKAFYFLSLKKNLYKKNSLTRKKTSMEPFSINSVTIMIGLLLVTTPSRYITLGSSNCPIIDASVRKSSLFLSDAPAFRVLIATLSSALPFNRNFPLQTSPNSP